MMQVWTGGKNWLQVSFMAVLLSIAFNAQVDSAFAQRAFGVDVSYWQGEITQQAWNYAYNNDDRVFAFVRASRGGTTGLGQTSGTPGNPTQETLTRRYDDSRFIQNMVRANNAGLMTGPYHFERADLLTNTGTDEANHFMQMAGAYMRPGYMLPMYDLEAGQAQRTQQELAQFSLDFSNRIYEVMKIRPSIYANGNYMNDLAGANAATRNAIAQPSANGPSMVSPAFPVLFAARYPAGSGQRYNEAVHGNLQTQNPKDAGSTLSWFFGPFDDYGNTQPWHFWQYSSGEAPFGSFGDTTTDGDVSQGDIEFVRDTLVPAVWWNDSSGDWSTFANWNSGQPVVAPQVGAGRAPQYATGPLPVARLPGAAGSGPTSGQYDTVILERPSANITVTISTGTHNVRKMYMRKALDIMGGTLTINYDPNYNNDFDNNPATNFPGALRSGPLSAQFSGAVTLGGTGNLSVNTLRVDAAQTFTLAGSTGALTFKTINLMPHSTTPAKIAVTGDVNINPLSNGTATIANGAGAGSAGLVDLSGGVRGFNIGNGTSSIDLDVPVSVVNGGITKSGLGTMRLGGNNTLGEVNIHEGKLMFNGVNTTGNVTVSSGGVLGGTGAISGAVVVNSGGRVAPGASIESLNVGALTFGIGSSLDIELGASGVSDLINVSGVLNILGGSVNLTNLGGLAPGTYTLIDYNTLTGSVANLGTPSGPAPYYYSLIDTGSTINLRVSTIPEPASLVLLICGLGIVIGRRQQR